MRSRLTPLSVFGFVVLAPAIAFCQVEEVEPFEGELSEGFESFGLTFETEIELFGGAALLRGTWIGYSFKRCGKQEAGR